MLTQGPAPNPKHKSNISSFLNTYNFIRLSHLCQQLYHHFIIINDEEGWDMWGWLIYIRVWVEGQGMGIVS